jgi:hypothetical protein
LFNKGIRYLLVLLHISIDVYLFKGRVVVLPRYEMATAGAKPSMIKLVSNAIVWLANGKSTITPGTHTTEQVSLFT